MKKLSKPILAGFTARQMRNYDIEVFPFKRKRLCSQESAAAAS